MKLTHFIAQHITEAHEGSNWTEVNIKDTLQDVSYKEAIQFTNASPNSIAMLLYHLTFYNDVVLQRLNGINPVINEANGFDLPPLKDEEEWMQLKEANLKSAHELAEAIENFPEQKLHELTITGSSTYYKNLHGIAEHAHYHLGQIVLLKNIIKKKRQQEKKHNSL